MQDPGGNCCPGLARHLHTRDAHLADLTLQLYVYTAVLVSERALCKVEAALDSKTVEDKQSDKQHICTQGC